MRLRNDPLPVLTYWECLWNAMHKVGWRLAHYSFTDEITGAPRHLIRAKRGEDELICSAPTLTQALQTLFSQASQPGNKPGHGV